MQRDHINVDYVSQFFLNAVEGGHGCTAAMTFAFDRNQTGADTNSTATLEGCVESLRSIADKVPFANLSLAYAETSNMGPQSSWPALDLIKYPT